MRANVVYSADNPYAREHEDDENAKEDPQASTAFFGWLLWYIARYGWDAVWWLPIGLLWLPIRRLSVGRLLGLPIRRLLRWPVVGRLRLPIRWLL